MSIIWLFLGLYIYAVVRGVLAIAHLLGADEHTPTEDENERD